MTGYRALLCCALVGLAAPLVGCDLSSASEKKKSRDRSDDDEDDRKPKKKSSSAEVEKPDPEVSRLIGVLVDNAADARTRVDAAESLSKLGAKAKTPLENAWHAHKTDSTDDVKSRIVFANAAGRLGPHGVTVLHYALSDSNMVVLTAGCQAVEQNVKAVSDSGELRPKFVGLLGMRKDKPECMSALVALAKARADGGEK